jgi:SAM-dependent methyltransferase
MPVPADSGGGTGAYGRYARVYDLVWKVAPYDRFVDLCLDAAADHGTAVRRVLVAACGTGNAAVVFARRGYRVTGFDLSPAMLARAAAKCRAAGRRVGLVIGDLRAPPLRDGRADLVVVLNASLNYLLEPTEVAGALGHLRRMTAPAGTVVVEPLSSRYLHHVYPSGRHVDRDGLHLDADFTVEGDLMVEHVRWSLDGVEESDSYRQRFYDDQHLEALMAAAGLQVLERRPMWPAIHEDPARGRSLWVARP